MVFPYSLSLNILSPSDFIPSVKSFSGYSKIEVLSNRVQIEVLPSPIGISINWRESNDAVKPKSY